MLRWPFVLALVMAGSVASAQPSQSVAVTDSAEASAKAAERRVSQLASQRSELARRYQDELDAIDRLKTQRASWRRDRELRDSLSSSLETANQLSAVSRELDRARQNLIGARRAYLSAIDGELRSGAAPPRRFALIRAKRTLAPGQPGASARFGQPGPTGQSGPRDAPHRIVVPDFEVDPLADPEELDQRAAELRATEEELNRQIEALTAQAAELDRLALLRKQHDRAGDLFNRDDDEPHRNTVPKDDGAGPSGPGGSWGHTPSSGPSGPSSFENYVPIVLADVIDASTLSTFAAAERSGDPARRAEAARKAHDAVAKRIEQVRKKRTEIEARAKQLRGVL
jgi:hypothetical protein